MQILVNGYCGIMQFRQVHNKPVKALEIDTPNLEDMVK
jgi:hypothetical protein